MPLPIADSHTNLQYALVIGHRSQEEEALDPVLLGIFLPEKEGVILSDEFGVKHDLGKEWCSYIWL